MKKNLLFSMSMFFILALTIGSCSKEKIDEELKGPKTATSNVKPLAAGDGKYDLLGYGYDVTGRLAHASSSKLQVLDIAKFESREAGNFQVIKSVEDYFEYTMGSDASSYSDSLSGKYKATVDLGLLKVAKLFKGELNIAFGSRNDFSAKYIYANATKYIEQKRMKLFSSVENLRNNYLTENFKNDINNLPASTLVEKYGTHVLSNITLGAKFEVSYRAETYNSKRVAASSAGLAVNGLFKIFSMNAEYSYNSAEANSNFNQTVNYRTIGGDGSQALIGEITLDQTTPIKLTINQWQSTCKPENATLVKIGYDGLIPLEDLILDVAKKNAVKSYINQYLKDNQVNLKYEAKPIYVMYSQRDNNHVYTHDLNDYPYQQNGFANLGINFYTFNYAANGALPVHVFYHPIQKNHVYTINRNDYPYEQNGFRYQGVNFYAFSQQVTGSYPVHVFYSPSGHDHVYTINRNDYPYEQNGFVYHGVNFYAFKNSNPF